MSPEQKAQVPEGYRRRLEAAAARMHIRQEQWTVRAKARFLRAFRDYGIVGAAAAKAKCGRRTVYQWLERDPKFKALYLEAYEDAVDMLETEARRRGVEGTDRPVYQGGKRVGYEREYSDSLLILLLKGKKPDTYRDRHEHTGPGGQPLPAPQMNVMGTVNIYMPDNGRPRRLLGPTTPSDADA